MIEKARIARRVAKPGRRSARERPGPWPIVLAATLSIGCSDLLTVNNPSEILADDLRNEESLAVIMNGVAGDFAEVYDVAILNSGHFANELIHTGSMFGWRALNTGIASDEADDVYDDGTKAMWVADDAAALTGEILADAASRPEMAMARIYGGFSRLLMADNFCALTVNGGPAITPTEAYEQALMLFTEGVQAAEAAGEDELGLRALAGRARTSLMLGDFQSARDDASQVPRDWRFVAIYSESNGPENSVATHSIPTFRKEGGVHPRFYGDPHYANDPRLGFINQGPDFVGEDRIRQFVIQTKYMDRNSPIPIASWQEARLIGAEAEAQLGNLTAAIALIDEIRQHAGLPAYDGPETLDAVLDQIMFERSIELYLEAKNLNDLRRTSDPMLEAREDCFPISHRERETNPNIQGTG